MVVQGNLDSNVSNIIEENDVEIRDVSMIVEKNSELRVTHNVEKDFDNLESLLDATDPPSVDVIRGILGLSHVVYYQTYEIVVESTARNVEKYVPPPSGHLATETETVAEDVSLESPVERVPSSGKNKTTPKKRKDASENDVVLSSLVSKKKTNSEKEKHAEKKKKKWVSRRSLLEKRLSKKKFLRFWTTYGNKRKQKCWLPSLLCVGSTLLLGRNLQRRFILLLWTMYPSMMKLMW